MERNILRFLRKQAYKTRILSHTSLVLEYGSLQKSRKQKEGTNLCAFYVAESIMSCGQRRSSDLSDLEYRRDRVAEEDQYKAIQEALAGFLNDKVIDRKGQHYYNGRLA
uniref:Uncharacterized protein n=1 Tax=Leersia perrieri TaxID=77586 RepID=A0A0D9W243_9ORYZ